MALYGAKVKVAMLSGLYSAGEVMKPLVIISAWLLFSARADVPPYLTCGTALGSAATLPTAPSGGLCGLQLARCPQNECCTQYGRCSKKPCTLTCQCEVSGRNSSCTGKPWAHLNVTSSPLPSAANAAPCGPTSAKCAPGLCCSSYLSFCTSNPSICKAGLCSRAASDPRYPCSDLRQPYIPVQVLGHSRRYVFNVTWGVRNISGFVRYVILINDQFPGPLIEATEGDTIVVTVHNQMDKSLMSIHWHGMLQRNNNIMDGVNGVTQKPLGPGQSQVYTFVADLQGTFWYHSHFKKQYMDGLRGPIRIHPFESLASLNAAANNFSLTIAEQYALVTPVNMPLQLSELYSNRTETNNGNTPQTSIIGAYGQGNCTGLRCDYYVVQAQPGNDCSKVTNQTLSLIFVNTGGFAFFDVSVDEHYLIVVSLDSVGVIPSNSSTFISLAPGQRVGVVVCPASPEATAKAQKGGLFWINATQNFFQVFTDTGSLPVFPTALGILSYDPYLTGPKVKALPTSNPWPIDDNAVLKLTLGVSQEVFGLQPISMTSILNGSGVPPEPTAQKVFGLWGFPDSVFPKLFFHVNSSFTFDPNRSNYDTTNGWIAMQLPKPSEESWLYDARNSTLPQNSNGGPNVLHFDKGDVVQFVFNNLDNFPHPFHIHGHWAWVMYQGPINDGPYVGQELISTPVLRDTIVVAEYSSLILRWVADNPGMWIMHCHIDGHLEAGLAFVLSYGEV